MVLVYLSVVKSVEISISNMSQNKSRGELGEDVLVSGFF